MFTSMGFNRRFRFVDDAARYDADILLICPRCNHRVIFERATIIAILDTLKVNRWIEVGAERLRCTACRNRGAVIELAPQGSPDALRLGEGDSLPPKGLKLSITQWCRLTEDERRRLRRAVRD